MLAPWRLTPWKKSVCICGQELEDNSVLLACLHEICEDCMAKISHNVTLVCPFCHAETVRNAGNKKAYHPEKSQNMVQKQHFLCSSESDWDEVVNRLCHLHHQIVLDMDAADLERERLLPSVCVTNSNQILDDRLLCLNRLLRRLCVLAQAERDLEHVHHVMLKQRWQNQQDALALITPLMNRLDSIENLLQTVNKRLRSTPKQNKSGFQLTMAKICSVKVCKLGLPRRIVAHAWCRITIKVFDENELELKLSNEQVDLLEAELIVDGFVTKNPPGVMMEDNVLVLVFFSENWGMARIRLRRDNKEMEVRPHCFIIKPPFHLRTITI